jgi:ABC-type lipoprotein release transport system permease subunit
MKAFFLVCAGLLGLGVVVSLLATIVSLLAVGVMAIATRWIPVMYNIRSLGRRRTTTLLTMLGTALVVFVFSTVLMLVQGIQKTLSSAGRTDNAIVLRKGASAEIQSVVEREQVKLLAALPGIAPDPKDGKPLLDAQVAVLIYAVRPGGSESDGTNLLIRGVSDKTLTLHDNIHLTQGRWFSPGTSEVVVGRAVVGRVAGAELGQEITFARRGWKVVGIIDSGGSSYDSEIWMDAEQAMQAFQRHAYSTVVARLTSESALRPLGDAMAADPRLQLDIKQERKFFEDLSTGIRLFLGFMGIFVAVVFSLGAILGAMISMYGQVAARTREIGTLRALGFRRSSVLVSFVVESVLLGLLSGAVGVALSSFMRFASFSTMNFATFSEVTFRFALTPSVVVASMVFATFMGYVGGLLPALRAARMPIVQATRG